MSNFLYLACRTGKKVNDPAMIKHCPNFQELLYPMWYYTFNHHDLFTAKDRTIESTLDLITSSWHRIYFEPYVPKRVYQDFRFETVNKHDYEVSAFIQAPGISDVEIWMTPILESLVTTGLYPGYNDRVLKKAAEAYHNNCSAMYEHLRQFY